MTKKKKIEDRPIETDSKNLSTTNLKAGNG